MDNDTLKSRGTFFLGLGVLFLVVALAGCSRRIHNAPSSSMEPTIPAGSKITIDYAAYNAVEPARFDIVAFRPTSFPKDIFTFRAVGLPGEQIEIREGVVMIDGKAIQLPRGIRYSSHIPANSASHPSVTKANLNVDEYFLLGDNTDRANDSRFFGPIKRATIIGKVIKIEPANAPYSSPAAGSKR